MCVCVCVCVRAQQSFSVIIRSVVTRTNRISNTLVVPVYLTAVLVINGNYCIFSNASRRWIPAKRTSLTAIYTQCHCSNRRSPLPYNPSPSVRPLKHTHTSPAPAPTTCNPSDVLNVFGKS